MHKVLVIEDNSDNLRLISYALNRAGYQVISADSGEAGVLLAAEQQPWFIIIDIMLPGIDGYEVARRIKALPGAESIPIVAITSFAMMGDREKVLAAGCSGYFEKPIDPLTIMESIHRALAAAGLPVEGEDGQ